MEFISWVALNSVHILHVTQDYPLALLDHLTHCPEKQTFQIKIWSDHCSGLFCFNGITLSHYRMKYFYLSFRKIYMRTPWFDSIVLYLTILVLELLTFNHLAEMYKTPSYLCLFPGVYWYLIIDPREMEGTYLQPNISTLADYHFEILLYNTKTGRLLLGTADQLLVNI